MQAVRRANQPLDGYDYVLINAILEAVFARLKQDSRDRTGMRAFTANQV